MTDPTTALHYTANGNFVNGVYAPGADGFNLADVGSVSELNALPPGVKGLVYLGLTNGADANFQATVIAFKNNPNLYGFYLADEPGPGLAANLKAESDWIHANIPGAKTFIIEENMSSDTSPTFVYTPANTDIDLYGLDPYPVNINVPNNYDLATINAAVQTAEADGIPQSAIVPVYQAFGGGGYSDWIVPTPAQEQQILSTWGSVVPNPAFDYAYSWGVQVNDTALSTDPGLQAVFAAHNGASPPPPPPPPPPPTVPTVAITSTGGTTTQAGQTITGTVDVADAGSTVTVLDGTKSIGTATVQTNGTWSANVTLANQGANVLTATDTNTAGTGTSAPVTYTLNPTTPPPTGGVPAYKHIVVVVEENHNYDEIAGNAQAPYINSLMATGANLTNYDAISHPSQPNYYALYAGSTFGTTDDNSHTEPDPTLDTVLKGAGLTFTGYTESQGDGHDFNHDPWVSFPEGTSVQTDFTSFPAQFPNGDYSSLPSVSYVIPDDTTNMHSGTIAAGDSWLQTNLSGYAQWAVNNDSLLAVVFDENDNENVNQVPAILYGADVVPGNYNTAYNHYNLLSTITAAFGLTAPNNAATAAPIQVFGTTPPPPAAPIITSPANGSIDTTTTKPIISGGGVTGDTVTISIDGSVAGTALVANSAWSFTPTGALTNTSHTITAMQAATGGSSSKAATDTFTVNVAPIAPTLSIADSSLSIAGHGGTVDLGISVTAPASATAITVTITGLPKYETITDSLDGKIFSGSSITLSEAEVDSGLTLTSQYRGSKHPVATLTIAASDQMGGVSTTSAPQSIKVTDPTTSTDAHQAIIDHSINALSSFSTMTGGAANELSTSEPTHWSPAIAGFAALLTSETNMGFNQAIGAAEGYGHMLLGPNVAAPAGLNADFHFHG